MNKGLALLLLLEIDKIFKDKEVDMFLLFGTALGAYREGQFIDGDDDIDLGSFGIEKRDEIAEAMRKAGFEVATCWDEWIKDYRESEMIHAWKDNIHVDIFFFVKQGKEWIANRAVEEEPFVKLPSWVKEFEVVKLHNHEFKVLSPIVKYLEFCYTDWKIPSKEHGKLLHTLEGKEFKYTLYESN